MTYSVFLDIGILKIRPMMMLIKRDLDEALLGQIIQTIHNMIEVINSLDINYMYSVEVIEKIHS